MAGNNIPLHIIVHEPSTEEGKLELARKAAQIHADTVLQTIRAFSESFCQKEALLEAVIETVLNPSADRK
ncbi:MAG: hypothetical protein KH353_02085 [Clostridium sp.]|nr:hypothetical protein [Clostridium sp.]